VRSKNFPCISSQKFEFCQYSLWNVIRIVRCLELFGSLRFQFPVNMQCLISKHLWDRKLFGTRRSKIWILSVLCIKSNTNCTMFGIIWSLGFQYPVNMQYLMWQTIYSDRWIGENNFILSFERRLKTKQDCLAKIFISEYSTYCAISIQLPSVCRSSNMSKKNILCVQSNYSS
jgi:hypothetical protein